MTSPTPSADRKRTSVGSGVRSDDTVAADLSIGGQARQRANAKEKEEEETKKEDVRGVHSEKERDGCSGKSLLWHIESLVTALIFLPLALLIWTPALIVLFTRKTLTKAGLLPAKPKVPEFAKGRPRLFFDGTGSEMHFRIRLRTQDTLFLSVIRAPFPVLAWCVPRNHSVYNCDMVYLLRLGATSVIMEQYRVQKDTCFFAISGGNISALCLLLGKEPM